MLNITNRQDEYNLPQLTEIINLFGAEDIDVNISSDENSVSCSYAGKTVTKNILEDSLTKTAKLALYTLLKEITGKTFPWGSMTGVRPLKKYVQLSEEGKSDEEIKNFFISNYDASLPKIELLSEINRIQKPFLTWDKKVTALYLHIPLCPAKCKYCSFPSKVTDMGGSDCEIYLNALIKEFEAVTSFMKSKDIAPESVYIGGGTPSMLSSKQTEKLLCKITEFTGSDIEFTVEAGRADTLSEEKLRIMKEGGVTRISLNPQTTNEESLKHIGRNISNEEFLLLYEIADKLSFRDINCDLILGLEGENEKDFEKSIKDVLSLNPTNITLHTLCVKRAADLTKEEARSNVNISDYQNDARKLLSSFGYKPYYMYKQKNALNGAENVGYALPGHECSYNIAMMGYHRSIYSAGASSSTKIIFDGGYKNIFTPKEFSLYVNSIDSVIDKKLSQMENVFVQKNL
ncbi:MAG: coproporphyrinogen dehydrogenase HemZ [Anaerofustis stercorihominis]|nr:coproporphyrinogen dehydrogenase HemZ [Anaerofustis stercorihominis]